MRKMFILFALLLLLLVALAACYEKNFDLPSIDDAEKFALGGNSMMSYLDANPEEFTAYCAELDKTDFVKVEAHETMGKPAVFRWLPP